MTHNTYCFCDRFFFFKTLNMVNGCNFNCSQTKNSNVGIYYNETLLKLKIIRSLDIHIYSIIEKKNMY